MTDYRFSCPECGKKTTIIVPIGNPPITSQHCGECGAKMNYLGEDENSQVVTNEQGVLLGVKSTEVVERENAETKSKFVFTQGKNPKILEFVDNSQIKTPWVVDVEESQQFVEQGLIIAKNKIGKKLHFKKGEKQVVGGKEYTELVPLSLDELRNLKIEESLNEQLFDLNIEESSEEPTSKKFNSQDIESMKEAKRIAEARIRELSGGSTETESENNEEKAIVDDIKEKLSLQLAGKGIEINPEEIKTQADLERWVGVIKKLEKPKDDQFRAQGGTAPLNQGQSQEVGFRSYPEMIDAVRDRASASNPDIASRKEAQKVLDALMTKAILGQKEQPMPFSFKPKEGDKGTLEILKDKYQRRKKLARGLE
jgi:hypothetical protein